MHRIKFSKHPQKPSPQQVADSDHKPEYGLARMLSMIFALTAILLPSAAQAAETAAPVADKINQILAPLADAVNAVIFWSLPGTQIELIVVWLAIASFIITIYFGFIQFRKLHLSVRVIRGHFTKPSDPGQLTAFQALSTALSGTVGLGNIAGVAVAITIGGPGAMIWMILMGLMGMATKFVECTLGVKYREIDEHGQVSGGPMYYLTKGLKERGFPVFGKVMGLAAGVMIVLAALGAGNLFQANQATSQVMSLFGLQGSSMLGVTAAVWIGLGFALTVFAVIIGGITSIAKVTSKLVPFMGIGYLLAGFLIIAMNITSLPAALATIFASAFSLESGIGGLIGAMVQGFRRASFSSEAGFGTASIAHSAVKTSEPTTEGLVALLEPFIDTVIICTTTALVIVITGSYLLPELQGVNMTSHAFNANIPGFSVVLTVAVVLFAFSTMISWNYYGEIGWKFLFGDSTLLLYKILFCGMCVMGAAIQLDQAVALSDAGVFALAFINILGLYFLLPIVKREVVQFFKKVENGDLS